MSPAQGAAVESAPPTRTAAPGVAGATASGAPAGTLVAADAGACCAPEIELPVKTPSPDYPGPTLRGRVRRVLASDDARFVACDYAVPSEEGVGGLVLCDATGEIRRELFVGPIAWEPGGGRLLVGDVAPGDDPRLWVVDVAGGQVKSESQRTTTRIGDRYDQFRGWQGDWICVSNEMSTPKTHQWIRIPEVPAINASPRPRSSCPPQQ